MKKRLRLIAILLLLSTLALLSWGLPPGNWLQSEFDDCPGELVCAKWSYVGGSSGPCCLHPEHIDSTDAGICNWELRHSH